MSPQRKHYIGDPRTILLCTDGSEASSGAMKAAVNLARECRDTKLIVLRVTDYNPEFETEGHEFAEKAAWGIREHVELIRAVAAEENVECKTLVRPSDQNPYKVIVEEAKKNKADLIIMGRRGLTGLKKVIMGSVTAKVVAYSPCNVLVVPQNAVMMAENILLATDGSKYSETAEREALAMSKSCHNILRGFTAVAVVAEKDKIPQGEKVMERVREDARTMHVPVEGLVMVGRPYEVIVELAKERGIDIIVMGTHGRSGFEKIFLGSVAERVVGVAPCAVLIVKPKK